MYDSCFTLYYLIILISGINEVQGSAQKANIDHLTTYTKQKSRSQEHVLLKIQLNAYSWNNLSPRKKLSVIDALRDFRPPDNRIRFFKATYREVLMYKYTPHPTAAWYNSVVSYPSLTYDLPLTIL
ncbi:uncharacterized protein RSE6_01468 [Rhynchosporium secalis]|uniref:Uncharacterized protein n=1 Tax=Rhynchosporium secalis TaxID=38038 RepID=A0A1E1LXU8_RHYSE|nr:uncharacterized protein RSE6_01468 [Rhynchosporium secalis]